MVYDISHDTLKDSESIKPSMRRSHGLSAEVKGRQGPLAEFKALRQEIERRSKIQYNVFALQLTTAAAIFSFAMSSRDRLEFLLIIPISTFMLCGEFVDQIIGMNKAAIYINEELNPCIPGGLRWELWSHEPHHVRSSRLRMAALMVAFPAIALGALAWAWPSVFSSGYKLADGFVVAGGVRAALIIIWIIGLAASVSDIVIIFRTDNRMPCRFIVEEIRSQIRAGELRPGQILSVPQLCKDFKVCRNTAKRALGVLKEKGDINQQGAVQPSTPRWILLRDQARVTD